MTELPTDRPLTHERGLEQAQVRDDRQMCPACWPDMNL